MANAIFFVKKLPTLLVERKSFCTVAIANREAALLTIGAVVQLVSMPACHAGGHASDSRTPRQRCSF